MATMDADQRIRLDNLLTELAWVQLSELHELLEHICHRDPIAKSYDALTMVRDEVSWRESIQAGRITEPVHVDDLPPGKERPE